ncbi:MAG: methionine synthase [Deltaproteobacteria bacterium]|nr:methionine synthase [Deltaproteobacteria bacterium]
MPTQVQIFPSIAVPTPLDAIYRRLGYRRGTTKINDRKREEIERHIDYALSLVSLKGAGLRVSLKDVTSHLVVFENGIEIESEKLARFLKGCTEALLIGSTAGGAVMDAIRGDTEGGDMTRGVIVDAVASEMTDAALDWIVGLFNRLLTRENARLTKGRFSAGYGDFLLEKQRMVYDLLELDRIGVEINENYILIPEKSVTAVAGIRG